jgi:hypothetical protein
MVSNLGNKEKEEGDRLGNLSMYFMCGEQAASQKIKGA